MIEMYFRYHGRISRFEFVTWGSFLLVANLVVLLLVVAAVHSLEGGRGSPLPLVALAVVLAQAYAFLCGSIALAAKRLRDTGRAGWHAFWHLAILASAVVFGWFAILAWGCAFFWLATEPSARGDAAAQRGPT